MLPWIDKLLSIKKIKPMTLSCRSQAFIFNMENGLLKLRPPRFSSAGLVELETNKTLPSFTKPQNKVTNIAFQYNLFI